MYRRLRILILFLRPRILNPNGFHIAELSALVFNTLSNLIQAHQKNTTHSHYLSLRSCLAAAIAFRRWISSASILLVEMRGVEPLSRTPFLQLHTTITYIIYLSYFGINSSGNLYILTSTGYGFSESLYS